MTESVFAKVLIALIALGVFKAVLTIELCGHSQDILRIVGGNETKQLEYPWMAFMRVYHVSDGTQKTSHIIRCDASIIDDQWLITAAHCFNKQNGSTLSSVQLKLGAHNISSTAEPLQLNIETQKFIVHPLYNHTDVGSKNDITLVKLPIKLDFKEKHKQLQPICLPNPDLPVQQKECHIVGWGRTSNTVDDDSDVLNTATVEMVTSAECKKVRPEVDNSELCAGHTGVSTCRGDSGGPLQCPLANGVWVVEGITSYGRTICGSDTPSVFTKVETFLDWINTTRKSN